MKDMRQLSVPLPPLDIQQRIGDLRDSVLLMEQSATESLATVDQMCELAISSIAAAFPGSDDQSADVEQGRLVNDGAQEK